jgi:hypothetical protein
MRLYFPVAQADVIEVTWGNEKREISISEPDGCLDLIPLRIPKKTPFTIGKAGNRFLTTTQENLLELEQSVQLVRCVPCRDIHVEGETLYPIFPTTTFYADDAQIVLFAEFTGVNYCLPITVSWHHEGKLCFGAVTEIPALDQESDMEKFVRSYAIGISINSDTPRGEWEVNLQLLTGRKLYRTHVRILNQKRPRYGESGTLFRPKPEGGRILDELVE